MLYFIPQNCIIAWQPEGNYKICTIVILLLLFLHDIFLISNNKLFLSMNGRWMTTYKNVFGCSLTHIQSFVKYDSTWFGFSRILHPRMRNCYFCWSCVCANIIVLVFLSCVVISLACYKLNTFYFNFKA